MNDPAAAPLASIAVRPGYAWYVVALLAALFAVSFMDRFMLALVVDPVSKELGLGDGQMALLLGAGFAALYSLGGLPIAQILDQSERRLVLIGGVVLWSATTILSAYTTSFAALAVCRAGVALGEAVLTPAAVSLIADLFPREKRALPISIYSAVSSVMVTGALVIDGAALHFATEWMPLHGMVPWRFALVLLGIPGLVIASVILLTVREPERTASASASARDQISAAAFFSYLKRHWRFYLPYYVGLGLFAMYSFATVSWVPTLLIRRDGMDAATTGYLLGAVGAPSALLSTFLWPWLATRFEKRGHADGIVRAFLVSMIVAAPVFVLAPLASSPAFMLAGAGIAIGCLSSAGSLTPMVVQSYGPNRMRARLMALGLLAINLVGYTLGPLIVVLISRHWPADKGALAYGLAGLGIISGPCGFAAMAVARRAVTRSRLLDERD